MLPASPPVCSRGRQQRALLLPAGRCGPDGGAPGPAALSVPAGHFTPGPVGHRLAGDPEPRAAYGPPQDLGWARVGPRAREAGGPCPQPPSSFPTPQYLRCLSDQLPFRWDLKWLQTQSQVPSPKLSPGGRRSCECPGHPGGTRPPWPLPPPYPLLCFSSHACVGEVGAGDFPDEWGGGCSRRAWRGAEPTGPGKWGPGCSPPAPRPRASAGHGWAFSPALRRVDAH